MCFLVFVFYRRGVDRSTLKDGWRRSTISWPWSLENGTSLFHLRTKDHRPAAPKATLILRRWWRSKIRIASRKRACQTLYPCVTGVPFCFVVVIFAITTHGDVQYWWESWPRIAWDVKLRDRSLKEQCLAEANVMDAYCGATFLNCFSFYWFQHEQLPLDDYRIRKVAEACTMRSMCCATYPQNECACLSEWVTELIFL